MPILTTLGAACAKAWGFTSGLITDQYFNLVSLLLPGNGTNGAQNNTFLDSSTNNFTITRNGNTTQGTFSPFSQTGWGNYFDGSGDYLSVANTAALQLSNSTAWTVELWFYATALASEKAIFNGFNPSGSPNYNGFGLNLGSNGQPATTLMMFDGTNWTNIATVSANQWYHVAVSYEGSGTTRRCFLNGVLQGSAGTVPSTITNTSTATAIGALSNGNFSFPGYISNVRVVKGTAVYTSNFTPPTTPLTAITNTSLLTCQSNRFVDNSGTPLTITRNGDASVVAFSPFAPTAAYTTAAVGGSGYFDGTGDYLNVVSDSNLALGTGDFTIEMWMYPTLLSATTHNFFDFRPSGTQGGYPAIYISNSAFNYYANSAIRITNSTIPTVNAWNHIALVRSGTTTKLYLNGAQVGNDYTSDTTNYLCPANRPGIGGGGIDTSNPFPGYLSNIRILKGTALYTGTTYTVPTSPPTAITNTQLLLNFTNAGITDATAKNDLETVGNAQISTSVSKFGGGSIAFDGTGDYLVSRYPTADMTAFGTGDFTIEMWIRFTNASPTPERIFLDFRPGAGNQIAPMFYVLSNTVRYYVNGLDRITSATISSGQWYHLAVARSGTSTKMFIDGTQSGSTYTDSNNYISGASYPVIGAARDGTQGVDGYIDDLRITKGYARYTANFTAPTAPFPVQ